MMSNNPKQIQILGIVGSPRRNGNTDILVDEVLHGAEGAGALAEKIILNELHITPCQGCDMCREIGKCIQKDDMSGVLEKMERSQLWVLGTPVYWWGPTAQFKAFIDRWYGAKHTKFEGRHVILTMPLAGGNTSYARHTVGMLTDVLNWQKTELTATILAPGVFNAGDVRNHTDVMMQAFQAGQKAMTIVR